VHRRGPRDAHRERADHGARDAAHAADDDDGEGEHDDLDADAGRHRDRRRHVGAAQRRQHRADDKGDDEDQGDVDAHHLADLAVVDHREQELAPFGAAQGVPAAEADDEGQGDHAEAVAVEGDAADLHRAQQRHGLIGEIGIEAPDQDDHVLEHQEGREGGQHDDVLVAVVEVLQQPALQHQAHDHAHDDGGDEEHGEAAELGQVGLVIDAHQGGGEIGAEGIERAVGDVQHLHDAEDHGQAHRHQEEVGREH
jgi:hypothetical protein